MALLLKSIVVFFLPFLFLEEHALAEMAVFSPVFKNGSTIPKKYTGVGKDVSPPLVIKNIPLSARTIAVVVDDPDAPTSEPWVHWIIYNIPLNNKREIVLPENYGRKNIKVLPDGAVQGRNSWGTVGYRGPLPPKGDKPHRYHFKVYALSTLLGKGIETKNALVAAVKNSTLATAHFKALFSR